MTDKLPSRPTLDIREALNELLQRNDRTQDKVVGDMFLGSDIPSRGCAGRRFWREIGKTWTGRLIYLI